MLHSHDVRIAILGTRGIPAAYGGFETLAWELSTRLADRGHDVTVYCRRGRTDEDVAGAARRSPSVRAIRPGQVPRDGLAHRVLGAGQPAARLRRDVGRQRRERGLLRGPAAAGTRVALNVDGIERQRRKWGLAGRFWYSLGERLALTYPNAIVSDADVIRDYYLERYGKPSAVIAYGAPLLDRTPPPDLSRHGLDGIEPGDYILYVSRLEPENQADLVIRAYRDVPGDVPLLIVGDAPYATAYKESLAELAAGDPRVRLTGAIYGDGYRDLQRGALAYVQATSVGGTHPALIEAMGAGNLVLAFETPENVEVTGGTGLLFARRGGLACHLRTVVAEPARRAVRPALEPPRASGPRRPTPGTRSSTATSACSNSS